MKLAERILLSLSNEPGTVDLATNDHTDCSSADTALDLLKRVYPDLDQLINGRRVVDFGCGLGYQTVALARQGASEVVGVDANPKTLDTAKAMLAGIDEQNKVKFLRELPPGSVDQFDVVISQNSMEHFPDPQAVLALMLGSLKPGGKLLISFGPPWYAPWGSHMHFFTRVPWVNIWFSEQTVMRVRSRFRDDGATRYEDVESGLNKMSVRKFERIVQESGLPCVVTYTRYECVKGLNFLAKLPVLREMFINHITCVIEKAP